MTATCTVPDCGGEYDARGYCNRHYKRWLKYGAPITTAPWAGITEAERFWSKVDVTDEESCWGWQGEVNNQGYGRFNTYTRGVRSRHLSHRYALADRGVTLTRDIVVLHKCDNPRCCNPAHLTTGTQQDNMRDALAKGRMNMSGLAVGWEIKREQGRRTGK